MHTLIGLLTYVCLFFCFADVQFTHSRAKKFTPQKRNVIAKWKYVSAGSCAIAILAAIDAASISVLTIVVVLVFHYSNRSHEQVMKRILERRQGTVTQAPLLFSTIIFMSAIRTQALISACVLPLRSAVPRVRAHVHAGRRPLSRQTHIILQPHGRHGHHRLLEPIRRKTQHMHKLPEPSKPTHTPTATSHPSSFIVARANVLESSVASIALLALSSD